MPTLIERIQARCDIDCLTGCWLWTGATGRGYGRIKVSGMMRSVHRTAYELLVGPVPEGLVLDHLCRVRNCANPMHLEPVTDRENILRGVGSGAKLARRTHCLRHPNVLLTWVSTQRGCRVCKCESARRSRESRKALKAMP